MGCLGGEDWLLPEQRQLVQSLFRTSENCTRSFRTAGGLIDNDNLRARLQEHADAWGACSEVLREQFGDVVEGSGEPSSVLESLRNTWMTIKSAVGNPEAILSECARREAEARECLTAARAVGLPSAIRETVDRIQERVERLEGLS